MERKMESVKRETGDFKIEDRWWQIVYGLSLQSSVNNDQMKDGKSVKFNQDKRIK